MRERQWGEQLGDKVHYLRPYINHRTHLLDYLLFVTQIKLELNKYKKIKSKIDNLFKEPDAANPDADADNTFDEIFNEINPKISQVQEQLRKYTYVRKLVARLLLGVDPFSDANGDNFIEQMSAKLIQANALDTTPVNQA